VLAEGLSTDTDVVQEYLAGVLAGSSDEDDTGTSIVGQIGRLSSLQLRLHYVIYRAVHNVDRTSSDVFDLRDPGTLARQRGLFIPAGEVSESLEFDTLEPDAASRISSALDALARERLIATAMSMTASINMDGTPGYGFDSPMNLARRVGRRPPGPGLAVRPSGPGIELFLWGCGSRDKDISAIRKLTRAMMTTDPPIRSCQDIQLLSVLPLSQ